MAIVVLAFVTISLGVWALSERGRADDLSADLAASEETVADLEAASMAVTDVAVVGGGPLTERQQEMVALVTGPWIEAWKEADGEAVVAFCTPDAVFHDIEGDDGEVLTPTDGTLESFASGWAGIDLRTGMRVHGDRMAVVLGLDGTDVGAVLDFTGSGEVLMESNALYNSVLRPSS